MQINIFKNIAIYFCI